MHFVSCWILPNAVTEHVFIVHCDNVVQVTHCPLRLYLEKLNEFILILLILVFRKTRARKKLYL